MKVIRGLHRLERGYAVDLVLGMDDIYRQIMASAPVVDRNTDRHFKWWDVQLTLFRIYRNLEDWTGLRDTIWGTLKCGELLAWERSLPPIFGCGLQSMSDSNIP